MSHTLMLIEEQMTFSIVSLLYVLPVLNLVFILCHSVVQMGEEYYHAKDYTKALK